MKNPPMLTLIRGFAAAFAVALVISPQIAHGQVTIYGNSAGSGPGLIDKYSVTGSTGTLLTSYTASTGNGRGIVVVGDVIYSTEAGDSRIFKTSVSTGLSLGSISTAVASMSTIAWDGSSFWTSDYSGTNRAFRIDITGVVTKTINLSLAGANYDGMEWFNGKLIANRGDTVGPYDVYDLNGNVLQANFINPGVATTGIAYDGTNFITSTIYAGQLKMFNGTTGAFIRDITLVGGFPLIEDLSVDYAARSDTAPPSTAVPEPSTYGLMGAIVLIGIVAVRRRGQAKKG